MDRILKYTKNSIARVRSNTQLKGVGAAQRHTDAAHITSIKAISLLWWDNSEGGL